MRDTMNEKNNCEAKLIGNFRFYDDKFMSINFKNSDVSKFQGFSRETIMQSTIVGEKLDGVNVFYLLVEDYIYNLLIPSKDGHKLLIKQDNENEYMLNVYSLNYQEVMRDKNILRRIKK